MNRIIKVATADICVDPKDAAAMITAAARRNPPMRATGLCETSKDVLLVCMEEADDAGGLEYVFAPFPSSDDDEMAGEISARYHAGFSTVGSFRINDSAWGLFAYARPGGKAW